jgi:hypothetical protein
VQTDETTGRPLTPEEEEAIRQEALAAQQSYAPVEPGMYSDPYVEAGQGLPQTQVATPPPDPAPEPYGQPGHYEPPYTGPGHGGASLGSMVSGKPVEPGMYEPTYDTPGEYAPKAPSATYGGEVWPPYWAGADHPTMSVAPRDDMVTVLNPSTGQSTYRVVPSGGDVARTSEGLNLGGVTTPEITNRGELLGMMERQRTGALGWKAAPPTSVPNRLESQQAWDANIRTRQDQGARPSIPAADLERYLRDLFGEGP